MTTEIEIEIDPIEIIYMGECSSLSGRSTLTYGIGRNVKDGAAFFSVINNTGKGMLCSDWVKTSKIHDLVIGSTELVSRDLEPLWSGKSVNTLSFAMACMLDIGLVEVHPENSRFFRHKSGITIEKAMAAHMVLAKEAKPVTVEAPSRKTMQLKPKEG